MFQLFIYLPPGAPATFFLLLNCIQKEMDLPVVPALCGSLFFGAFLLNAFYTNKNACVCVVKLLQ
eukprot:m.150736 g.150736  ORF g.150736 m.150736 type:complete len:65 (-) comp24480_c0_seq1:94-288(-)